MTAENTSKVISIKIVSDNICPFCFLGKRRLEKAIAEAKKTWPHLQFDVKWSPFLLDPSLTKEPVLKMERYKEKFGATRVPGMIENMKAQGAAEGIAFDYGGFMASTIDSHRLVALAGKEGKQNEVVEEIFKAYFEKAQNIADIDVLADVAARAGMDRAKIKAYLQSTEGQDEVKYEIFNNQSGGVSGVPHFYINEKIPINGAQDPTHFLAAFKYLVEEK